VKRGTHPCTPPGRGFKGKYYNPLPWSERVRVRGPYL